MASGYIYKVSQKRENNSEFKNFLRKKSLDLLLPYTWFAILIWCGKFLLSEYVVRKVGLLDLVKMFVDPVAFMWFIYLLFYISIFIWGLEKITSDNSIIILMILIPMTCTWIFFKSGNVLLDRFLYYPLYYYLGVLFCKKPGLFQNKVILWGSAISYVILFVPYCEINTTFYLLKIVENAFASVFFFVLIHNLFKGKRLPAAEWLGKNSMYIYILHPVALNAIRMVLLKLSVTNWGIWCVLLMLVGLGVPVAYAVIANRYQVLQFPFRPRQFLEKKN
jgi:fucose 4-O-acetylase-like acetyltransferase